MARRRIATLAGTLWLVLALAVQAFGAAKPITLAEVEAMVAKTPEEGKYLLVDSRPDIKYIEGHLPWARSIPWQEMKERSDELPADKATRLVFYCGGVKCDLSAKAAALASELGYTDVSVFVEGEPAWKEAGKSLWVSTGYIKLLLNDRERVALVVDARPDIKYLEGTVPGAINISFADWEKRKGLLPADKNAQLIFFCGGFKCDLSHKSAAKAREMGYTDVRIYAEGWPVWKEKSTRAFALVNPKEGGAAPVAEATPATGEISKDEFLKLVKEKPADVVLVDVRSAEEYQKAHLPGAINIADEKVAENAAKLKGKNVVFYCNTGSKCAVAHYAAEDAGLKGTTRFLNKTVDFKPDGSFEIK